MKFIIYSLFVSIVSMSTAAQSLKGNVYELDDKGAKIPLIGTNMLFGKEARLELRRMKMVFSI